MEESLRLSLPKPLASEMINPSGPIFLMRSFYLFTITTDFYILYLSELQRNYIIPHLYFFCAEIFFSKLDKYQKNYK